MPVLRVTQAPVELIVVRRTGVRVTQVPLEYIAVAYTGVRVTQAPVEYLRRSFTPVRVTQMVVEIIVGGSAPPPPLPGPPGCPTASWPTPAGGGGACAPDWSTPTV